MERLVKFLLLPAFVFFCCCLHGTASGGGWGEWSQVSGCSKTCGMGLRTRVRQWHTGEGEAALDKPFTNTEQFTCFISPCPQNGSWSVWGMWGECSAACGGGTRKRHRDCNSPPPENGGANCEGEKFDEENCKNDPCPPLPANFNLTICARSKMLMCENKKMCVHVRHRCDGKVQCSDGSDELGCWRRDYELGHVRFSSLASRRSVSIITAVLTVLTTSWCVKLLFG